jgi:hypothetical protein
MSTWFSKVKADMSAIPDALDWFEKEYQDAKLETRINGSVEKLSRDLPGVVEHRFSQLQEIEAILEHLNILMNKKRTAMFRKYLENYNRALTSRDAEKFADGDDDVVSYQEIINEVALMRNKWQGIIKGLDIKGFQINNVIKLKVAGQEDFRL